MISYYGDFPANATVYIPFNTFDSNDPTASVTVTDLANTDVHIHKDGGTTQRNNSAGITMSLNFDSITGNHLLTIDTSDTTVADFWQAGHEYQVRIEGATVDAGTINAWVGAFSIERSGGALALLKSATYGLAQLVRSTTPANTLTVDANHLVGVPATQKVDVETIKTQAVTCAAGVTVLASVGTAATSTAQTGDSYAIVNGDHGLVSIQDDIDAILADTGELQTNQGNWLTATGFSTHSAADVVTAMETNGSKLDHLWEMTEDDGGVRRLTTNSLEQAPSGGLNATQIAEAVWDAVAASYDDASSMGALLNDAGAGASAATIADAVWDEAIADHTTATTFGGKNQKVVPSETINDYKATGFSTHSAADVWGVATRVLTANTNLSIPSAADIADAVWDEASTGHTDAGKAGTQLWTVLDAVPNTTEFEARTLPSADYTVVTDLGTVQTGDSYAIVNGDHGLVSIQDDIDAVKTAVDLCEDILRNKMEITDADGTVVLRADNNVTALYTVAAGVTDDLTTTIRKRLE